MSQTVVATAKDKQDDFGFFERYLTLWVALCMVAGVAIGKVLPNATAAIRNLEFGEDSQINAPAVLIWLMITPVMMKVDFSSVRNVRRRSAGLIVTLLVNWIVKPFSMAALAWLFFKVLFAAFISPQEADPYIAGCIILATAPCTAMFFWSHLTDGDPAYTLVQVSVNDLLMLILFVPIVQLLVSGASSLMVPFYVLLSSVVVFIAIPLVAGTILRNRFISARKDVVRRIAPSAIRARHNRGITCDTRSDLRFQADNITTRFSHVLLIAIPITLQVYFNSSLAYGLMNC